MLRIVGKRETEKELQKILKGSDLSAFSREEEKVRKIIQQVARKGDAALRIFTKRYDGANLSPREWKVTPREIQNAYKKVRPDFLESLRRAIKNIQQYHEKQKTEQWFDTLPGDVLLGLRTVPVENAGLYVPGGRAVYPSSVLMNAIPAKIAGVPKVVMVSPPNTDGTLNSHVLVAAAEVQVDAIYKIGGAQAIAALAYGTDTIPRVDMIVGPGNIYVTLAKKLLFGTVGIDKLAGPSNVVIIADADADPRLVAADLLAQAEHDPESQAVLLTPSAKMAFTTRDYLVQQLKTLPRRKLIEKALRNHSVAMVVDNIKRSIDISNQIAPEHLQVFASPPQRILEQIKNAGAVFLGPYSPAVVGDYMAGPNHVLPTAGAARFSSPLGVWDFIKRQSVIGYSKAALEKVRVDIERIANVEGLDAHARSVSIRFD